METASASVATPAPVKHPVAKDNASIMAFINNAKGTLTAAQVAAHFSMTPGTFQQRLVKLRAECRAVINERKTNGIEVELSDLLYPLADGRTLRHGGSSTTASAGKNAIMERLAQVLASKGVDTPPAEATAEATAEVPPTVPA